jgi:hypothetical protein
MAAYSIARWDHDHQHVSARTVTTVLAADVAAAKMNVDMDSDAWYAVKYNPLTQEWEKVS